MKKLLSTLLTFMLAVAPLPNPQSPKTIALETVRDLYINVLTSNASFYWLGRDYEETLEGILNDYNSPEKNYDGLFKMTHFTLMNVFGSDIPAVVVELNPSGTRTILHYNDGIIYGGQAGIRQMNAITTEGIFFGGGSASNHSIFKFQLSSAGFIESVLIGECGLVPLEDNDIESITGYRESYYHIYGEEVTKDEWYAFDNELAEKGFVPWYEFFYETIDIDFINAWNEYFS